MLPEHVRANTLSALPIDSVYVSPNYYADKTYLLNYMDISVFFAKDIDTHTFDLDLSLLPSGIYVVHFYLENGEAVSRKIIKK